LWKILESADDKNINMKILITGIPGMGKTTIGEHFESNYSYKHFNFEDSSNVHFYTQGTASEFIQSLTNENVVATWGFRPFEDRQFVLDLKNIGFELIWFDGNRVAAFREFMRIKSQNEQAYYLQLYNIIASNIINIIQPITINTFNSEGEFRNKDEIAQAILGISS